MIPGKNHIIFMLSALFQCLVIIVNILLIIANIISEEYVVNLFSSLVSVLL